MVLSILYLSLYQKKKVTAEADTPLHASVYPECFTSVFKIFTESSSPNHILPWQMTPLSTNLGSGFAISDQRILTNAHVVDGAKYVMIRKIGSVLKYHAEVKAFSREADLAVLTVSDPDFWNDITPLPFGNIPSMQDSVIVVGYPMAGDNLSVTKGVVSRVEPQQYVYGSVQLLAIQIDAAINPGNSGGPSIMDGKVVGVAFQALRDASNIGWIIPVPIIKHFLEDSERNNDSPKGFCSLGITAQDTDNAHLKSYLRMGENFQKSQSSGIIINKVHPLGTCKDALQKHDILLEIDGHSIACDGTVHFRKHERIGFQYIISKKYQHDICKLKILRDGAEVEKKS